MIFFAPFFSDLKKTSLMYSEINPVDNGSAVPTPADVVNIITDFGLSASVIDSVEAAFLEFFNSDTFVESSREYRSGILLDYKLAMDTLRGIQRVEQMQYSVN